MPLLPSPDTALDGVFEWPPRAEVCRRRGALTWQGHLSRRVHTAVPVAWLRCEFVQSPLLQSMTMSKILFRKECASFTRNAGQHSPRNKPSRHDDALQEICTRIARSA